MNMHNMAQYCSTLLYIHNMAQYCSTLLVHAEHAKELIYITCAHIIWHSTALHYLYTHNMAQYCSSWLLLHTWYGTVLFSVTLTCTSFALHYLHMPLTNPRRRVIVKALHVAFHVCEVHQNIWWSCKQANTCEISGCHSGIAENTSVLGCDTGHVVPSIWKDYSAFIFIVKQSRKTWLTQTIKALQSISNIGNYWPSNILSRLGRNVS
jgi:hypothetical protein